MISPVLGFASPHQSLAPELKLIIYLMYRDKLVVDLMYRAGLAYMRGSPQLRSKIPPCKHTRAFDEERSSGLTKDASRV